MITKTPCIEGMENALIKRNDANPHRLFPIIPNIDHTCGKIIAFNLVSKVKER